MATVKDIAARAGTSAMTVSRYFNDSSKVKEETKKKIEEAVKYFNYSPNTVAQSLVNKRTNIIYVYIAGDIGALHPFLLKAIAGIGEELGCQGYSMLLRREAYTNESCDGIIALGTTMEEEEQLAEHKDGKKLLLFGNNQKLKNWIDIDNQTGSEIITNYVLKKGYTKIAYIGIEAKKKVGIDRKQGFLNVMNAAGVKVHEEWMLYVNNHEIDGYNAAEYLLKHKEIEVIICASDILALGVIRYANQHGISVPEELGVTGFDGLGFEVMTNPPLTTVEQPVYEAGKQLAAKMIRMIENKDEQDEQVYISPILRENGTV